MYSYLTILNGVRAGSSVLLDDDKENRVGRGLDCHIVLMDPLTSRVHALIVCDSEGWWLRDANSRNGSYVNGQKVHEARLADGCTMRFGTSEFAFHQSSQRPDDTSFRSPNITQTVVRDLPLRTEVAGNIAVSALQNPERAREFLVLYQLAIKLLGCDDPDEVVDIGLDLLHERTRAAVVGFLWRTDDNQLQPKRVVPEKDSDKVKLSETLTELVCRKGHAVWLNNHTGRADSLLHFADAICVPIRAEKQTLGAIHIYLERGRFSQTDFDVAISTANILGVALARARRQAVLLTDHQRLASKSADVDELIGESRPMVELKSKISRVARATGCVLIRGESGSGKELVARAVHRASPRSDRPMLSINCAAIPRDLMESQLFGHRKGSFTGADTDHVGLFEQADSGTLFLDEVGEMTLEGQAKLLRILEGHPFLPVGSTREVTVDVRVIAATNRDLSQQVREQRFREDLYYRLSVFELPVPPLRERGEDLEILMKFFHNHFKLQHGRPQLEFSAAARRKLLAYHWPGNVRQLRNVIDSAVVMAEEDTQIGPHDLGLRDTGDSNELDTLKISEWEQRLIREALSRAGGKVPEAARMLGLGRATLYRKIDEYGIDR